VTEILPRLWSHLKDTTGQESGVVAIRVPMTMVIVKLLKLLPSPLVDVHLPRLITEIVAQLKSRSQLTRDQTRTTLCAVAVSLGPQYFRFILQELSDVLRRGFEVHVLGHTIHSLLHHLVGSSHDQRLPTGSLDYCLAPLLRLLLHDIFGDVAEQKEVEKIQRTYKEAKNIRSFDSFALLAQCIDFEQSILFVMQPLKELLQNTTDHRQLSKIEEILRHISLGLLRNPSVKQQTLCIFVHQILRSYLHTSNKSSQTSTPSSSSPSPTEMITVDERFRRHLLEPSPRERAQQKPPATPQQHVLVMFALNLLLEFVKNPSAFPSKPPLTSNSDDTTSTSSPPPPPPPPPPPLHALLDPFVPLLVECIRSPFDNIVVVALKVSYISLSFCCFL
jgi:hypothetical protein